MCQLYVTASYLPLLVLVKLGGVRVPAHKRGIGPDIGIDASVFLN